MGYMPGSENCNLQNCLSSDNGFCICGAQRSPSAALENLVGDCFMKSISQLHDEKRLAHVDEFEDYVKKVHCEESLHFLIEIFKYEYIFENLVHEVDERDRLKSTRSPSPQIIPLNINDERSVTLDEHEPMKALVSTMDDIQPTAQELNELNTSVWDDMRDSHIDNNDSEDETPCLNHTVHFSEKKLNDQWNYIINNYIKENAPDQINVSCKNYNKILNESASSEGPHRPTVLLDAKKEVMQLIQENVYIGFLKSQNCPECKKSELPCSITKFDGDLDSIRERSFMSPNISPASSISKGSKKIQGPKSKLLHLGSPNSNNSRPPSPSSASPSISSFLGHLKLCGTPPNSASSSTNSVTLHHEEKPHRFKLWKSKKGNETD
ncbi:uncharacterized protein PRCAT00002892001 [Priceomyces carsonii]|uniref:uncharacterized protein n=1 Tax=Priceomyces carsonii TaxID=28549 RepID=UPI002ED904E8|nr:unnamed protein product [Priceomyces carsonii]